MATPPPIKSAIEDIDALTEFLRTQVGWISIEAIKKAIPARHADNRKIEAVRYLGFIERDGANVKLTDDGRNYAGGAPADRVTLLRKSLRSVQLYNDTLTWLHWNKKETVNKADVANYWHDKHENLLGGAAGAALTDAAVFFMRLAGAAGLGKFVSAGVGRETHVQVDRPVLESFVTGETPAEEKPETSQPQGEPEKTAPPPTPPAAPPATPALSLGSGLNVNVEIHIAADAKAATIEEIFKNMRKYLIDQPDTANGG
jgi:hypothetical protein